MICWAHNRCKGALGGGGLDRGAVGDVPRYVRADRSVW